MLLLWVGVACQGQAPQAASPTEPGPQARQDSPAPVDPGPASTAVQPSTGALDVYYDFEAPAGGTLGWTRAWGEGFDDASAFPLRYSTELASKDSAGALQVDVDYRGDGREAVVTAPLPPDLESFDAVSCDVFLDASLPRHDTTPWDEAFDIGFALNDDWQELGSITPFSFETPPTVTLNGRPYYRLQKQLVFDDRWERRDASSRFVIRLAGKGFLYKGPLFVDNIVFHRALKPTILPQSFVQHDSLFGDHLISVRIVRRPGVLLDQVRLETASGKQWVLRTTDGEHYSTLWHTLDEPDGPTQAVIRVLQKGESIAERRFDLFIQNGGWTLQVQTQRFDQLLTGSVPVVVRIGGAGGPVQEVQTSVSGHTFTLEARASGEYAGTLDTTQLPEGPATLVVKGRKGRATQQTLVDVIIRNRPPSGAVSRAGTEFMLDGKPFRYLGWNSFNLPFLHERSLKSNLPVLIQATTGEPYPAVLPKGSMLTFQEQVDREMLEAWRVGLQVVRTWGYRTDGLDTGDWFSRIAPGGMAMAFNEAQFRKFDYLLDSAQRHGIKVVIVLQNYWTDFGGIKVIMDQLGSASRNRFFVDPTARRLFKEYIDHFVFRQNTVNGQRYVDDPAIFSWELMNEPRMDGTYEQAFWDRDGHLLGAWLREMSTYLRGLDHTHLIASGAEGHPFQGWGLLNEGFGRDPFPVMDQPDIDYFTVHFYPNRQQFRMTREFASKLLTDFVRTGKARGKPVVMEEWGFETLYSVKNADGEDIEPDNPSYAAERLAWHQLLLSVFDRAGGNGSHLWGFQTSAQDRAFGINVYSPASWVKRDRPFVTLLKEEAGRLQAASVTR